MRGSVIAAILRRRRFLVLTGIASGALIASDGAVLTSSDGSTLVSGS